MKLPSLDYLARNTLATLRRFPWVIAMACAATGMGIWFTEASRHSHGNREHIGHILMACYLGISLLFGLSMLLQRSRLPKPVSALMSLMAIGLLALYAYSMEGQADSVAAARYSLYLLASHLFVAVAPFLRGGYSRGFWEYNHRLFMRIIIAVIFSGCLYMGLTGALAAVKHLFGIPIPEKVFLWLWMAVSGIFNTWFFLAGVPGDFENLEQDHPYPRVLQVLTQYLLAPLVTLYLVILYAYASKIAWEQEWPIGWVSYLVLVCSLLGILSLLLIHPIQERRENQWIKAFSRYFYFALFPLLALLFAAIGKRISEYRLTENRYFVLIMAIWLTGIALYFTFNRVRNIKVIPVTLGILALLGSFGPWGAFQLSLDSQVGRLRDLLESQGLLKEGKMSLASSPIAKETEAQIGSVVEYLEKRKQLRRVGSWLADSARAGADSILRDKHAFLKQMGLVYIPVDRYGKMHQDDFLSYSSRTGETRRITGFDYYLGGFQYSMNKQVHTVVPGPDSCLAHFFPDQGRVRIMVRGDSLMDFDLKPLLDSLKADYPGSWHQDIPADRMYREQQARGYTVGLQVQHIYAEAGAKGFRNLVAAVLVKLPAKESP
jgi:hypothetical protein